MTSSEFGLCVLSVVCSSVSQLYIKSAATRNRVPKKAILSLFAAGMLQLTSVFLVVLVLRTMKLSQLVPFAAAAYFLVPIGSHYVFKERLHRRFWAGAALITAGIVFTVR